MKINHKFSHKNLVSLILIVGLFTACQHEADVAPVSLESRSLEIALGEALGVMDEDPDRALEICDKVIEEAKNAGAGFYVGKAYWYKGYVYDAYLEDISNAYFNYKDALDHLGTTDSSELKMSILNNLGILYRQYAHYDAAIENYNRAIMLEGDLTEKQASDLYYNLGVAYNLKGDPASFENAEVALTKSLALAERITDHGNIASIHNYIGLMYKEIGNYEVARIAYNNTIRTYQMVDKSNPVLEYVGKAYHGIGVTYMDEGAYEEAIGAFEKALVFKTTSSSIFVTKFDLGTVYQNLGQTKKAIKVWKEAVKEKHNQIDREHVEIYAKLTDALASEESFEDAVGYAQEYNQKIKDLLGSTEKYARENDQILFADIIKQYAEFRKETPYHQTWWFLITVCLLIGGTVYGLNYIYYRKKISTKVSENITRIQMEFDNLKLD